ncbi:hypothetical protein IFM46972_11509 [Aspergillus udagawae]|uniref:Uncharacterized protein n=1 Tax=Aspergillus udagawae TaxID=91492 RepID=A0A8H3XRL5_9EURO|nr:hypothetical protein IFM46972_11509 [Aspergillus udagawae]
MSGVMVQRNHDDRTYKEKSSQRLLRRVTPMGVPIYMRWPADQQTEHNEPISSDDIMGEERHDQVYYFACPTGQLGHSGAWSAPIPVLSGVELISPYVNRADGGYTILQPAMEDSKS